MAPNISILKTSVVRCQTSEDLFNTTSDEEDIQRPVIENSFGIGNSLGSHITPAYSDDGADSNNKKTNGIKRKLNGSATDNKRRTKRQKIDELAVQAEVDEFIPKKFYLSGYEVEERKKWIQHIESLDGMVVERVTEADILVIKKLMWKFHIIIAICTGIRLVSDLYLSESVEIGKWANVNYHELGCPLFEHELDDDIFNEIHKFGQNIVNAAYRWRIDIINNQRRPFEGWNVILYVDPDKADFFRSIIEHGGGVAYDPDVLPSNMKDITHAIVSKCLEFIDDNDMELIRKNRMHVYDEEIIPNTILGTNKRDVKGCYHEKFNARSRRFVC